MKTGPTDRPAGSGKSPQFSKYEKVILHWETLERREGGGGGGCAGVGFRCCSSVRTRVKT